LAAMCALLPCTSPAEIAVINQVPLLPLGTAYTPLQSRPYNFYTPSPTLQAGPLYCSSSKAILPPCMMAVLHHQSCSNIEITSYIPPPPVPAHLIHSQRPGHCCAWSCWRKQQTMPTRPTSVAPCWGMAACPSMAPWIPWCLAGAPPAAC